MLAGEGRLRNRVQLEPELPQLLVILLTATLFDGGNSYLNHNLLVVFALLLTFEFRYFVSYLVILFADQHLRDAFFVILGLVHVPDFFPDLAQVLVQTCVRV